jgi:hypothetical protein
MDQNTEQEKFKSNKAEITLTAQPFAIHSYSSTPGRLTPTLDRLSDAEGEGENEESELEGNSLFPGRI